MWRVRNGVGAWGQPDPDPKPRLSWDRRRRVVERPRLSKSDMPDAAALAPDCPRCGNSLAWRGGWHCDACPGRVHNAELEAAYGGDVRAWPRALPRAAVTAAPIFSSGEGYNCASSDSDKEKWRLWLDEVELATNWWRRSRAARLRYRGGGVTSAGQGFDKHWHAQRIRGQAERFERIRSCGEPWATFRGERSDGKMVECELEKRCDVWRLCAKCMARRRFLLQTGILEQRKRVLRERARELRRGYAGPEGRWSEKLITLTVPHGDSPGHDARVMTKAWRLFSRKFAEHFKLDRGCKKTPVWVRALEIAPGDTGGHAHTHVWFVGPFIDHALMRVWWGDALRESGAGEMPRKAWADAVGGGKDARVRVWLKTRRGKHGRERETVPWPVVDVMSPGGGEGAAKYAQKVGVALYAAKSGKGEILRMNPVHAASVYEGLESARAVQWCRGWAPHRKKQWKSWGLQKWTCEEKREWASMKQAQNATAPKEREHDGKEGADGARATGIGTAPCGNGNGASEANDAGAGRGKRGQSEHQSHARGSGDAGRIVAGEVGRGAGRTRRASADARVQLTLWKHRSLGDA